MRITGGQAIVKALEAEGVDIVFGYPGGAILPVYDSLRESGIRHVLVRHEQAAAHAASGYARSTGRVGVCISTSGPGATNLVTGIATAYMDSIPIVAITGQVSTDMIGRDVFQEVDITGATEPFCKHNYLLKDVRDIPRVMKEAFHIASTGRPGPVLIDLPKDVALNTLDFHYPKAVHLKGYKPNYEGHPLQIKRLIKAIQESEKPLICVGGGVISSNAHEEVRELAERLKAPVATTLMGIGAFPGNHPLSLGMLGMHGSTAANRAIQEADLLMVLGARMGDRAIGKREEFGKSAILVHVDIDPAEIGKNVSTDIPIVGDLKRILREILKAPLDRSSSRWDDHIFRNGRDLLEDLSDEKGLDPRRILTELSKLAPRDMIIVTDVGQHQMWTGQYYPVDFPRTFITSGGLGTMGYGLPAAIGVKLANPKREVLLVTGDGSFQMSLPELATVVQEGLSIKILIMNNQRLGMVRELQQQQCGGRYFAVEMRGNPDFVKLAEAYGIQGFRVESPEDVTESLRKMLDCRESILGDFRIHPDANVTPLRKDERS